MNLNTKSIDKRSFELILNSKPFESILVPSKTMQFKYLYGPKLDRA
jgi:hypothetical protein